MNDASLDPARERGRKYLFDGVMLDECAGRLFVDGRERLCSERALSLLSFLCAAPRQAHPSDLVVSRLWPSGRTASTEALTQAVFRARACLGPYANRLLLSRGIGVCLDASVRVEDACIGTGGASQPDRPVDIALQPPPPTTPWRPSALIVWSGLLLLALAGAAWLYFR